MESNLGVEQRLERLEQALVEERQARAEERRARRAWIRRTLGAAGALLAVTALVGGIRVALAAPNCMQTLPAPLLTLCAGYPATAADINGNFNALATNLVNKVGPLGAADATLKSATVGADLRVSGTAYIGFHRVNCLNANFCLCPVGEVGISGGAICGNGASLTNSFTEFVNGAYRVNARCTGNVIPTVVEIGCARVGQ